VEFVDALPTTATGKVQRFKLRERVTNDLEAANLSDNP
jgi:acyl-coenzyme A synthetase/AMP-(fatty) acid ligase